MKVMGSVIPTFDIVLIERRPACLGSKVPVRGLPNFP
jgi:hypothetical protein